MVDRISCCIPFCSRTTKHECREWIWPLVRRYNAPPRQQACPALPEAVREKSVLGIKDRLAGEESGGSPCWPLREIMVGVQETGDRKGCWYMSKGKLDALLDGSRHQVGNGLSTPCGRANQLRWGCTFEA
ncbi:hypothetical protein C9413_16260 [Rhizobium sp. SEMIA 4085]|uniref:hypothetical protein n=1 Tax=Rhizobium TaxID=379 RepID=UPI00147907D1|nr:MULTISPECIES: hypothetical protein [Rhizobium]NNH31001.1 hypothetical protein [Rhizobium sp. SEMIA 4085]